MSKSNGGGLFGSSRVGAITVIDPPMSRVYAHRARLTYYVVAIAGALMAAVVLWQFFPPYAAIGLGVVVGFVLGVVAGAGVAVWPVVRVVWHWAAEVAFVGAVLTGWTLLTNLVGAVWALLMVVFVVAAPMVHPGIRRAVIAWFWCMVVRHRLRMSFAKFVRSSTQARAAAPLVLWARPTPAGERVWVWLRPGLDLADLDGKAGKLAVACWAATVRVAAPSARHSALVRIDITRRDPLTALVRAPLADVLMPWDDETPVSPGMPPLGLDLDDVPEPPPAEAPRRR